MAAHLWADTCAADALDFCSGERIRERRVEMTLARWREGKAQLYEASEALSQDCGLQPQIALLLLSL